MFSRKHNGQTMGDLGTAAYTNVPTGAGTTGGTANYPAGQKVASGQEVGYGYDQTTTGKGETPISGQKVSSQKMGYGFDQPAAGSYGKAGGYGVHDNNVYPQQNNGYVHQTPVSYNPDGTPVYPVVKKSHKMRNVALAALAACCCCVAL